MTTFEWRLTQLCFAVLGSLVFISLLFSLGVGWTLFIICMLVLGCCRDD